MVLGASFFMNKNNIQHSVAYFVLGIRGRLRIGDAANFQHKLL